MSLLNKAEPHLAALKLVVLSIQDSDYDVGRQIGSARFNLFKAISTEDLEGAASWLNTLDVGLGCLQKDGHQAAAAVAKSLAALRELLVAETQETTT
jgi:hypothetical protein